MRPIVVMPFVVLTLVAPVAGQDARFGLSEPKPRTPESIRIATYNMLNFFDHVDDPALEGEHDDMNLEVTDGRCRQLAAAIRAIDADVIAIQEMESLEALAWFRDNYLGDAGYEYVVSFDVGYYRGIECSVLSRFEVTDADVWPNMGLDDVEREGIGWAPVPPGESIRFQRSPLKVDIRTPSGYEFTLFSIHHKAGRSYNHRREAEALRIVEFVQRLQAEQPERNIVVMGDFNAAPWDRSLRTYLEAGMVDTMAHRNLRGEEGPLYKSHESDRILDYILLNASMFNEFVPGSSFIYGTLTPPDDYDWQTDPYPDGYASDHYPVVIDLVPEDRH